MSALSSLCQLDFQKLLYGGGKFQSIIFLVAIGLVFFAPVEWLAFSYLLCSYSVAMTLISVDERAHSGYLYSALPSARRDIVFSRFAFYFLLACLLNIVFLVIALLGPADVSLSLVIMLLSVCFSFNLIYIGVIQALCYRFKYSTVRMGALIVYASFIAASVSISTAMTSAIPESALVISTSGSLTTLSAVIALFGLFCYLICYILGVRLYTRKDIID